MFFHIALNVHPLSGMLQIRGINPHHCEYHIRNSHRQNSPLSLSTLFSFFDVISNPTHVIHKKGLALGGYRDFRVTFTLRSVKVWSKNCMKNLNNIIVLQCIQALSDMWTIQTNFGSSIPPPNLELMVEDAVSSTWSCRCSFRLVVLNSKVFPFRKGH